MYLSRIAINKERRETCRALATPQKMHAAVLSSFPPKIDSSKKEARTLWRIDRTKNETWLYVLSDQRPDFHHIVDQFGWPESEQSWETKDYQQLLGQIKGGQTWRFRLRANPVKTVDKKRIPLTAGQQKDWLRAQAEKNGFSLTLQDDTGSSVDTFELIERNSLSFKKSPKDKTRVTLSVATFEGVLTVENSAALKHALCFGLGKAKAYGCGLLTLARA